MNLEHKLYFRDALREARAAAHRDAEGFQDVIHVLENMGTFMTGSNGGLARYGSVLHTLARASPLSDDLPLSLRDFHTPFCELFDHVRIARNEAIHEGAIARHLAGDAAILALVLEDALMAGAKKIGDFMIRRPQCAELWQPLSFIRQIMLVNSYSHLPVKLIDDSSASWRLVDDAAVARFTRTEVKAERLGRLRMSLSEAVTHGLELRRPCVCAPETSIQEALELSDGLPILVTSRQSDQLIGFVTPFDLL